MPTANADVQPSASIDGTAVNESMPSGFISVGSASSAATLVAVTANALEEMDERQLTTQVCFRLVS